LVLCEQDLEELILVDNKVLVDLKIFFRSLAEEEDQIHKILILTSEIFSVDEWVDDKREDHLLAMNILMHQNQNQRNQYSML
jgi:hypothetical protein